MNKNIFFIFWCVIIFSCSIIGQDYKYNPSKLKEQLDYEQKIKEQKAEELRTQEKKIKEIEGLLDQKKEEEPSLVTDSSSNNARIGLTGALVNGSGFGGLTIYTPDVDATLVFKDSYQSADYKSNTKGIIIDLKRKIRGLKDTSFILGVGGFFQDGKISGMSASGVSIPIFLGIQKKDGPLVYTGRLSLYQHSSIEIDGVDLEDDTQRGIFDSASVSVTYLF